MKKKGISLLMAAVFYIFSVSCFSQNISLKAEKESRNNFFRVLEKESPNLASLERRLFEIQQKITQITKDYQAGKISKTEARQKLKPLIKEQVDIRSSSDYMVEQQLVGFLFQK